MGSGERVRAVSGNSTKLLQSNAAAFVSTGPPLIAQTGYVTCVFTLRLRARVCTDHGLKRHICDVLQMCRDIEHLCGKVGTVGYCAGRSYLTVHHKKYITRIHVERGFSRSRISIPSTFAAPMDDYLLSTLLKKSHAFLISTTHRIQSPCFITSKALLILSNGCRCVMNSSTFSLPVK